MNECLTPVQGKNYLLDQFDKEKKCFSEGMGKATVAFGIFKKKMKWMIPAGISVATGILSFLGYKYAMSGDIHSIYGAVLGFSLPLAVALGVGFFSDLFNRKHSFHVNLLSTSFYLIPDFQQAIKKCIRSFNVEMYHSIVVNLLLKKNILTLDQLTQLNVEYTSINDTVIIQKSGLMLENYLKTELLTFDLHHPETQAQIQQYKDELTQLAHIGRIAHQDYIAHVLSELFKIYQLSPSKENLSILNASLTASDFYYVDSTTKNKALDQLLLTQKTNHTIGNTLLLSEIDQQQISSLEHIANDITVSKELQENATLLKNQILERLTEHHQSNKEKEHIATLHKVKHYFVQARGLPHNDSNISKESLK